MTETETATEAMATAASPADPAAALAEEASKLAAAYADHFAEGSALTGPAQRAIATPETPILAAVSWVVWAQQGERLDEPRRALWRFALLDASLDRRNSNLRNANGSHVPLTQVERNKQWVSRTAKLLMSLVSRRIAANAAIEALYHGSGRTEMEIRNAEELLLNDPTDAYLIAELAREGVVVSLTHSEVCDERRLRREQRVPLHKPL